jgi:hypothetical protein
MKNNSTIKPLKNAHTPNTKQGMGNFYGSGLRNPVGKVKEGFGMKAIPEKKMKIPPKSVA